MLLFRQVILQYKDGPKVRVPEGLLHEADNGQQYLRFRPSSTSLTRALLGHMGSFKTLKNPSLSCSPQVSQLREAVKAKILNMGSKEPADGGDRENLFAAEPAGDEEDDGNEVTSRKLREVLEESARCSPNRARWQAGGGLEAKVLARDGHSHQAGSVRPGACLRFPYAGH